MTPPAPAARPRTAKPKLDAICADAVDLALRELDAATEDGQVGAHRGVEAAGDRLVAHTFEATMDGYAGWYWLVTVARAPRAKSATVCETVLVPGETAVLAPEWVPWAERLEPSDVGPGDALPYQADDDRLEQGFEQTDPQDEDQAQIWELGLGRKRVLSPEGRADAATRWDESEFGPRSFARRQQDFDHCRTCGFLTLLDGSMRGAFGVCTNQWSPADGRVVSLNYGCGAHSETDVAHQPQRSHGATVMDETTVDVVEPADGAEPSASDDSTEGSSQD